MADVMDAIDAGRRLIGVPYGFWGGGHLESYSPMWMADDWDEDDVLNGTINCSGLINVIRALTLGQGYFKAGTAGYGDWISPWEYWDSSKYYPVGTLLIEPYVHGVTEGHIVIISRPDQTILQSTSWYAGGYPGVTEDRTSWDQNPWTPWTWAGFMPDLLPPEYGGPLDPGTVTPTTPTTGKYPGDTATPLETAAWMAYVAGQEFGLPGILPVMTSCTELTQAWIGPGDVKDVPGYDNYEDHYSLGWFQQQVGIWDGGQPGVGASVEQILDPEWSLRSFLTVAKEYEGDYDPNDPVELGYWCQAVQNSAVPTAYVSRGYPIAKNLLDQLPTTPVPVPVPVPVPIPGGGEDGDMSLVFSKYTFVADFAVPVDATIANAAYMALEAMGIDALSLNGRENIKATGDAALKVDDLSKLNCLVVGKGAHDALSEAAKASDTWARDEPIWALWGASEAETLHKVRKWALSWIAYEEQVDLGKLDEVFQYLLLAIDPKKYQDLLEGAEGDTHPDPPPPSELSLEEKVDIMWAEYKKEHA